MEVTLITNPKYTVDFAKYLPERKKEESLTLTEKVYGIGVEIIKFFGVVISSTFHAGYLTLRYAVSSFVRLVLNSFAITDFYFGAFKVAYWVFSLGFTFVATAVRRVMNTYSSSNELYLSQFVKDGIDLRHIQTKDIQLDTSEVPEEVKVADLLTLFDAINFEHPDEPGFMPPTTRQEDTKIYTAEELREGLGTFVTNVNGRVAFLGTPSAHDTVRLNAFYQQIEDAVRLSLHKVTRDLGEFKGTHPDLGALGEEDLRTYRNLLEDQARLVIDLAIAGKHCGARYMGDAMSSYFNFHGEAEVSGTLEDTLIELLAAKRNEVALAEIQRYFGTSTHGFSQYMQHMGGLLAIPGTQNVIEHLSGTFDYTLYLRSFFEIYTEDFIIDAVQEKIKKSQAFREQIMDWFKTQVGTDWDPESLSGQEEILRKLGEAQRGPVDPAETIQEIEFFIECLRFKEGEVHGLDEVVSFPNLEKGWLDFVQQVFALDEVKGAFNERFSGLGLLDRMRKRQDLIQKLSNSSLGKALETQYQETGGIVLDGALQELVSHLETVKKMKKVLPVNEEVLLRILIRETQAEEVVQGYLQGPLYSRFLYGLNIEGMPRDGLSPVLIEWLLDAHHIFVPNDLVQKPMSRPIGAEQALAYRAAIDPDGNIYQMQSGESTVVQEILVPFLREEYASTGGKRYIFGAETDVQEVARLIFEKAFKQNSQTILLMAESMLSSEGPFYPNWKTVVYIRIPEVGAAIFGNTLLKVVLSCVMIYKLVQLTRQAYEQSGVWANRFHRYVTKEAHPQIREAYRNAYRVHRWINDNKWKIFFYGWLARLFLFGIPHPLAQRVLRFIDPTIGMDEGDSYLGILFKVIWTPLTFGWKVSSRISSTLQYSADRAKDERLSLQKRHCYSLWNQVIQPSV
ncbi:MAG: hypothetical protein H7A41_06000 [Chlamydiales bacterium]|nr:hypothetical protein [Chlamydiales bacterium]